uniref:Tyrosine-protein phosphatase 99A-like n=1 Tax=Drosophila rhopaloa TaxID=1041015 RepID=A0A6P4EHP8_DRORH
MPRPQHHALLRALLKLLLFASIAEHCATALPTNSSKSPSSPSPFTAAPPLTTTASSVVIIASSSDRNLADLVNPEAETTGSGWETLETDFNPGTTVETTTQKPVKEPLSTAATSIEQQDQPPDVPSTTLAFANAFPVPVAGEMGNGNVHILSGSYNDATPPYAAVDDNYGK